MAKKKRPSVRNRGQFQAIGQWLRDSTRLMLYERDNWICGGHLAGNGVYCGEFLGGRPRDEITIDHIKPRHLGGTNKHSNLITSCVRCNAKKSGKEIDMTTPAEEKPATQEPTAAAPAPKPALTRAGLHAKIRDRIVEMRRIASEELLDHSGNPRQHPNAQKNAMQGILDEIGIAQALVVWPSERNGGKLTVLDGHLRKNQFRTDWPCLVTDLNDEEADLLIQAFDAVGSLALIDKAMMEQLRADQEFADASVRLMLDDLVDGLGGKKKKESGADDAEEEEADETLAEMELQPYEHYDYVLVLARNTFDWNWLCERLGLRRVDGSTDRRVQKAGLGRAIPAERLISVLRQADEIIAAAQPKE